MVSAKKINAKNWNRWRSAYHESGHAIAAFVLGIDWVDKIEIGRNGSCVHRLDVEAPAFDELATFVAGSITDELFQSAHPLFHFAPGKEPLIDNSDDEAEIARLAEECGRGSRGRANTRMEYLFKCTDVLAGLDAVATALFNRLNLSGSDARRIYQVARDRVEARR